jgi:hypothetical protein
MGSQNQRKAFLPSDAGTPCGDVVMPGADCRSSDKNPVESARAWQNAVNIKNMDTLAAYFADDSLVFYPRPSRL